MSILDDLGNPPKRTVPFLEWLISQPAEVREKLEEAALDTTVWSDTALEQLLRKHGAQCSKYSIRVWRADVASR